MPRIAIGSPAVPVAPSTGALQPLGLDEVRIDGGFWAERQQTNTSVTLNHIHSWLEREGWLGNFDLAAAGELPVGRRGREFSDSEVYKYLEAVAWDLYRLPDPDLEARFRDTVSRVAAAQEADGYLNTRFGREGQGERWSDLEWGHELYCLGHLFQSAVARERTAPAADDGLVEIARRAADLVCEVFGAGGIQSVCGHAEVEVGLAELGRALHEPRYLEQSQMFVDRRGRHTLADIEWGRAYFQDDEPVRDAVVLRGHAVRANYLAAGATDVAIENQDRGMLDALRLQWQRTVERRTYITGGQGSHHQDEAFGEDWELPADRAYSETCAGIGSIMFSWRLLLSDFDAKYADLIERTLFNVVATSPSRAGDAFFYANTLHQRNPGDPHAADEVSKRASSSLRAPWFEVSCCPPNVARTFASLGAYVATKNDAGVQIHQYAASTIRTRLPGGEPVAFEIETDYPRSGVVRIRSLLATDESITLSLRVPSWAETAALQIVDAVEATEHAVVHPGYANVTRSFREGDVVVLTLPMDARFTFPDPRIDAVRGTVAVERGPEVYCLESTDLSGHIEELRVDAEVAPVFDLDHVVIAAGEQKAPDGPWPYLSRLPGGEEPSSTREIRLIPYHSWGERGISSMRVWLPVQ